ncbi:hypothetical protein [Listeria welshimeri]|uniref:hypothetical protein n=1 Tax=Listeria welshimeri TaxID=1643 RepID=UPI0016290C87|nr:hypothetical protein [Listeria welshimeri]MBC1342330.1 hypothetical protein [Listeria welshimeri]MBC1350739.1 hypothetical protein [Listeria welshimeri]MBC1705834.1 hypothetical protein [Listeria welshimeri]MBF2342549.1 hypothetical protein [Listeria welshimeri]
MKINKKLFIIPIILVLAVIIVLVIKKDNVEDYKPTDFSSYSDINQGQSEEEHYKQYNAIVEEKSKNNEEVPNLIFVFKKEGCNACEEAETNIVKNLNKLKGKVYAIEIETKDGIPSWLSKTKYIDYAYNSEQVIKTPTVINFEDDKLVGRSFGSYSSDIRKSIHGSLVQN